MILDEKEAMGSYSLSFLPLHVHNLHKKITFRNVKNLSTEETI